MRHPSDHHVKTIYGNYYSMNSCHHQLCYPYNLPKDKYEMISWTEGISDHYQVDKDSVELEFPQIALDENGEFKEPEMIWYPETRCLGVQGHPF